MSIGGGSAKRARREAEAAANAAREEARRLRKETAKKEKAERDKVQRKLIRNIKGKFNPFEFLPNTERPTLGGDNE